MQPLPKTVTVFPLFTQSWRFSISVHWSKCQFDISQEGFVRHYYESRNIVSNPTVIVLFFVVHLPKIVTNYQKPLTPVNDLHKRRILEILNDWSSWPTPSMQNAFHCDSRNVSFICRLQCGKRSVKETPRILVVCPSAVSRSTSIVRRINTSPRGFA